MTHIFNPPQTVFVPVINREECVAVRRIYCLVRNYAEHAREMGFTGLEAPFTFLKPADTHSLVVVESEKIGAVTYPSLTNNFQHEVELVIVIGLAGKNIQLNNAFKHIYGYAVGLDLTRRDLQVEMAEKGRPWCIGKAFDNSAVIGPITHTDQTDAMKNAEIWLHVNGIERQRSKISEMIWGVPKIIEKLSTAWELQAGDLIYTGTPQGVGPLHIGDYVVGEISGLSPLHVQINA